MWIKFRNLVKQVNVKPLVRITKLNCNAYDNDIRINLQTVQQSST